MSTDPPPAPAAGDNEVTVSGRTNSFSQQSDDSQTAAEFIRNQELLEADAREALPYSIESCTKILGPLRQSVFACMTCNPPPSKPDDAWTPAGVCYACSVQCHGEHTLVEIFQKRNFTCDCGTTRIPATSPCALRVNEQTNTKGGVHSEEPDANNRYNQNFRNRFCGCECDYDPFQQKGTMFQCLGLGTVESGGCGEDWYHPGCLVGMGPKWYEKMEGHKKPSANALTTIAEGDEERQEPAQDAADVAVIDEDDEPPMPPGFPEEDDFEGFLCYKCVEANPWVKKYAGTFGFLPAVFLDQPGPTTSQVKVEEPVSKKRKAEDDVEDQGETKRVKNEDAAAGDANGAEPAPAPAAAASAEEPASTPAGCKLPNLATAPAGRFSLFFKEDFRDKFCRCTDCFRTMDAHPQLLEEEEVYEPPMSEGDGASQHGGSTHGSGSLLERGESALRNVDRVRAIEGVMAYNHLKEQLKPFFQQFAESGKAVGAEDIKAYFAKLRGDEQGIQEAGRAAAESKEPDGDGDSRREQSGY
ncbi:metaphase-anaphase transition protein (Mlo2) [Purpureocillium lavendulum]|uniref:Metaphase-anaphase transition protein (Mlo2) n=1 Tax=Purpureocillium lavendulum TaxID=1247861 RepID=A0AB34FVW7_9HYPO|nr:metaphase-anaphase transition protein (Mlo2) [Purpureocillium lavendulum]